MHFGIQRYSGHFRGTDVGRATIAGTASVVAMLALVGCSDGSETPDEDLTASIYPSNSPSEGDLTEESADESDENSAEGESAEGDATDGAATEDQTAVDCESVTGEDAAAEAIDEVPIPEAMPEGTQWDLASADISEFNACDSLSPITVTVEGATGSSPHAIMLFKDGEWLGTATAESYGFTPDIERVDQDSLEVTYPYLEEGDANAAPSGEAVATFTWNDSTQSVEMAGEVPPEQ